jgi:DnaJ like chaperone protein
MKPALSKEILFLRSVPNDTRFIMKKLGGKIAGTILGLLSGAGPVGAAFGFIMGHIYDTRREADTWPDTPPEMAGFYNTSQQAVFATGVIILGAKMAKADGRVTREEIDAFKRVFRIAPEHENQVGEVFNQARKSVSGFEPYAFQLAHVFHNNAVVLEEILSGLFIIAAADSAGLSTAEMRFLERVAVIFGFDQHDFERVAARAGVMLYGRAKKPRDENAEAYAILGVAPNADAAAIKSAYRALIREHHPDRLTALGVPPDFIANATEKMKRINAAYAVVCKARGIK